MLLGERGGEWGEKRPLRKKDLPTDKGKSAMKSSIRGRGKKKGEPIKWRT